MTRLALVALLCLLALPASAAAKGPHASLTLPAEAPQPGEPWRAKLMVFEFSRGELSPPLVVARRGEQEVALAVQPLRAYVPRHPDVLRELRYRVRGAFPDAGGWRIGVVFGPPASSEFRFGPVRAGGSAATSLRHRFSMPRPGEPLPPEVVAPPAPSGSTQGEPARLWIPAGGLALAGAAVLLRRRFAHRGER